MIDCKCGKTFLNINELEDHAVKRVVLHGDDRERHQVDHDGPSVWHQ